MSTEEDKTAKVPATEPTPEEPEAKKQKIDESEEKKTDEDEDKTPSEPAMTAAEPKNSSYPMAPDSDWPEAWYMMDDGTYEDQKALNRLEPNKPATVKRLKDLGIGFWKMDAETYKYPAKAIPWDPKDATDPKLKEIRDAREY